MLLSTTSPYAVLTIVLHVITLSSAADHNGPSPRSDRHQIARQKRNLATSQRKIVERGLLDNVIYLQNVLNYEICLLSASAKAAVLAIEGKSAVASGCVEPLSPAEQAAAAAIPAITPAIVTTPSTPAPTTSLTSTSTSTSSTTSSSTLPTSSPPSSTISTSSSSRSTTSTTSTPTPTISFTLSQSYIGSDFLTGFDFFTDADPTHGQVNFLSQSASQSAGLVSINSNGAFVMQADDYTTLASGVNRNSVRISSKATVKINSLVILDTKLMPFGKSVWPAFWMLGQGKPWPASGEIDVVEGVYNSVQNQMTLHSNPGCNLKTPMAASGTVVGTSCDSSQGNNNGCGVLDKSTSSYGSSWNAAGGGVYATYFSTNGISIWEFNRANIPTDISNSNPNITSWGQPKAFWDSSSCNIPTYFGDQTIIFDITICGDWAGNQNVWSSAGYSGTCSQAVEDPSNFVNAIFEVNYVKVFTLN